MLRFGAFFALLFGLAAALNGLTLMAYGERVLPVDGWSRIPAGPAFFEVLSDTVGSRAGSLLEGSVWLAVGLALALLCADTLRPFLPRAQGKRSDVPLRDPIAEPMRSLARRLAGLKGPALVAAVAAGVAAISALLLNGA